MKVWVAPRIRDGIVEFVGRYAALTGLAAGRLLKWIGLGRDRCDDWRRRAGQGNRHNAPIPRDHWMEARSSRPSYSSFLAILRKAIGV